MTHFSRRRGGKNHLWSLYEQYLLSVIGSSYEKIVYLNYDKLTIWNLGKILLDAFRYTVTPDQMALMQGQFDYYSKDDSGTTRFVSDREKKQTAATPEIRKAVEQKLIALYNQLEQSNRTLTFTE